MTGTNPKARKIVDAITADWSGQVVSSLRKRAAGFSFFCLIHAVAIGVEADWTARHATEPTPLVFRVLETLFATFFTVELAMRLIGERSYFLSRKNKSLRWNLFDGSVVMITITQELIGLLFAESMKHKPFA